MEDKYKVGGAKGGISGMFGGLLDGTVVIYARKRRQARQGFAISTAC